MKILFLAAEAEPFYKIGGLADYAGSLPFALFKASREFGNPIDIRIIIPFHNKDSLKGIALHKTATIRIPVRNGFASGYVNEFKFRGLTWYLIRRAGNPCGFNEVYPINQTQAARKFIFFSLAAIEFLKTINWQPDIVHANDWHTAQAIFHLAQKKKIDPFFKNTHSLLTIHNLPFIGEGSQKVLRTFKQEALPPSEDLPKWALDLPLPMGLKTATQLLAVSPSYAEELKVPEFGDGLTDFFIKNSTKLSGILNGIDTETWDPEMDPQIQKNYSLSRLNDRKVNKEFITEKFGLSSDTTTPLVLLISRLSAQKGIDMIIEGLPNLEHFKWNAIFLGSGDKELENGLSKLQAKFKDRMRVIFKYDNQLSHQLYASGDILLMPSRYEPCGLSQMIAMRYGCIPVARAVGGLKDSIVTSPGNKRTGYLFSGSAPMDFSGCLATALKDFNNKKLWLEIQTQAMNYDFSWNKSALSYLQLYKNILAHSQ